MFASCFGLLGLLCLIPPASAAADPLVLLSRPVLTLAPSGLKVEAVVENRLPVAINAIAIRLGSDTLSDWARLPGRVDAGTAQTLEARLSGDWGGEGEVSVQLWDYTVTEPIDWGAAQRLLTQGGAPGERNFLRQLTMRTAKVASALPSSGEETIPRDPSLERVRMWTARVLWAKCRGNDSDLTMIADHSELGKLEDGFGLLRGQWLLDGKEAAPLSAALLPGLVRFSELVQAPGCPLRDGAIWSPFSLEQETTTRPRGPSLDSRSHVGLAPLVAIIVAILIFFLGLWLGRRRANE